MPNKEDKLGALWQKTSSRGDYFSGQIEINGTKHQIVVFANGYKDKSKQPDWIIYKSQPREQ
jgi:putative lipoic acid-binding regulatory protein